MKINRYFKPTALFRSVLQRETSKVLPQGVHEIN
jgi:hypothetical protein